MVGRRAAEYASARWNATPSFHTVLHICFRTDSSTALMAPRSGELAPRGGIVVSALDFGLKRSRVRVLVVPLSGNNLGQVVRTRVPVPQSSVIWYRSRGGDALRLGR